MDGKLHFKLYQPPYTNNTLKKVQKSNKGFFRDSGILHHLLKVNSLEQLQVHPVAGFSFESYVTEALIRGLNNFIKDTKCPYGIVINRGKRIELLANNIIQIPAHYILRLRI